MPSEDMREMFEFSLRRTYELLLEQLQQARRTGKAHIKVCRYCHLKLHHLIPVVIVYLRGWWFFGVPIHVREDQVIRGN